MELRDIPPVHGVETSSLFLLIRSSGLHVNPTNPILNYANNTFSDGFRFLTYWALMLLRYK